MIATSTETNAAAMQASAEGQIALVQGDVALAQAKYAGAGEILEREIRGIRKAADIQVQRFLAATQYYKGGHYRRGLELAGKIDARLLPKDIRLLLPPFLSDAKARATTGYAIGVRKRLYKLWVEEKFADALEMLRDHPYVFGAGGLAFMRAVLCEQIGQYRAAALFFAAARRHGLPDLYTTVAFPLKLNSEGRLAEAWEYVTCQIEVLPHPITFVTASVICHHRAIAASLADRTKFVNEQLVYLEKAWEAYKHLPEEERLHPDMRSHMAYGLESAAMSSMGMENVPLAKQYCERAIEIGPNSAVVWSLHGEITHPSEQSAADFREAIRFPDADFFPFAMLAALAWERQETKASLAYCQQALERNPSPNIAGQLYGWMAICKAVLQSPRVEVEALFKKALELAPGHGNISDNYRVYLDRTRPHTDRNFDLFENVVQFKGDLFDRKLDAQFSKAAHKHSPNEGRSARIKTQLRQPA